MTDKNSPFIDSLEGFVRDFLRLRSEFVFFSPTVLDRHPERRPLRPVGDPRRPCTASRFLLKAPGACSSRAAREDHAAHRGASGESGREFHRALQRHALRLLRAISIAPRMRSTLGSARNRHAVHDHPGILRLRPQRPPLRMTPGGGRNGLRSGWEVSINAEDCASGGRRAVDGHAIKKEASWMLSGFRDRAAESRAADLRRRPSPPGEGGAARCLPLFRKHRTAWVRVLLRSFNRAALLNSVPLLTVCQWQLPYWARDQTPCGPLSPKVSLGAGSAKDPLLLFPRPSAGSGRLRLPREEFRVRLRRFILSGRPQLTITSGWKRFRFVCTLRLLLIYLSHRLLVT